MARPKNQDERRAHLIQAVIDTTAETGLRSLSLADVARKAGLTRGAVLYYYDDLDALLREAYRAGMERFCDRRDALRDTIENPALLLRETIRAGLPTGPDDALMRLLYEFDVLAENSPLHSTLVESMYERQLAAYRAVLERGAGTGVFHLALDTSTAALNLVALEDAYGLHIVAGNSQISVERALEAMFDAARAFGAPVA
ncbi:TetR/AcrR family transcriptional regulator [Streptomyces nodosus]|uniref:TetR family transcriptional regulator n=1 Tax=Streptomyces nodosus TaxID=40318 RepID=A0A0B5D836_9ACTN|nr:TetR family transcriptional regulator [Streptomyces nodosus]AJE39583.1 TetR family transcriptional regulator [Streptomyces nodosus]MBB4790540.1 AcrR family transcriptional regulator [Streptomyces nodosus]QEV38168.1 TetR family transcriptional regulator [Streptomyces nodosus]